MVYLLHRYLDATGETRLTSSWSAIQVIEQAAHPRSVQRGDAGLAVVLFLHLLHRPGWKIPAGIAAGKRVRSASRTCDFMLKEEAYHMFVGASGVGRVVQRSVELMKRARHRGHSAALVASTSPTLQRYLNFHYSVSLDLFGAETSTNSSQLLSRPGSKVVSKRSSHHDDHRLLGQRRGLVPSDRRTPAIGSPTGTCTRPR